MIPEGGRGGPSPTLYKNNISLVYKTLQRFEGKVGGLPFFCVARVLYFELVSYYIVLYSIWFHYLVFVKTC